MCGLWTCLPDLLLLVGGGRASMDPPLTSYQPIVLSWPFATARTGCGEHVCRCPAALPAFVAHLHTACRFCRHRLPRTAACAGSPCYHTVLRRALRFTLRFGSVAVQFLNHLRSRAHRAVATQHLPTPYLPAQPATLTTRVFCCRVCHLRSCAHLAPRSWLPAHHTVVVMMVTVVIVSCDDEV